MFDRKKYMKEWRLANPEYHQKWESIHKRDRKKYMKEYLIKFREKNKKYIKKYRRQYYIKNREKEIERAKQYYIKNPKKVLGYIIKFQKMKYRTNLRFNLNSRIKAEIKLSLKGNKNGRGWEILVGYTLNDLIKRLQSTMPKRYGWQNFIQGKLHIDHIIPIRAFIFNEPEDEGFKMCWNLCNLRLLPSKENLLKRDKINPILLGLLIKEFS